MTTPRTCFACKNCIIDPTWGGTEETPGTPADVSCQKRWFGSHELADKRELHEILILAASCPDFTPEEWLEK